MARGAFLTCDQITTAAFSFMDWIDRKKIPCTKSDLYLVTIHPQSHLGDWDRERRPTVSHTQLAAGFYTDHFISALLNSAMARSAFVA
jgi:hypothetical protein